MKAKSRQQEDTTSKPLGWLFKKKEKKNRSSLVAQWVKDPVLSLLWLGSRLWYRSEPWSKNFHMPWIWETKKIISVGETMDKRQPWGTAGRNDIK